MASVVCDSVDVVVWLDERPCHCIIERMDTGRYVVNGVNRDQDYVRGTVHDLRCEAWGNADLEAFIKRNDL